MYIATPIVSMKKKIGRKVFPDFIIAFKFVVESIMCFHHFLQFCIRHQRRFRPSRNPRFESARYSSSSRSLDIVLAGHIGRACTLNTIGATETAKQYVYGCTCMLYACVRIEERKRVKQEGKKLEREAVSNAKRVWERKKSMVLEGKVERVG